MSQSKSKPQALVVRTRDAAAGVIPLGKQAGSSAAENIRRRVRGVRGWAAPQLHDAADAVDSAIAPRVSGAMRATARKVSPDSGRSTWQRGMSAMRSWPGLAAIMAVLAAAGAAAAATLRRRCPDSTSEVKDAGSDGVTSLDGARSKGSASESGKDKNRVSASSW